MEFVLKFRSHQMKNNDENLKTVVMQRVDDMDKTFSSRLFTFSTKMYTYYTNLSDGNNVEGLL